MRIIITVLALIIYVGVFCIYVYELPRPDINLMHCKMIFFSANILMLIFREIDMRSGFVSFYHEQFNTICYASVIINLCLCLAIITGLLNRDNWQTNLYIFNGSIFATSVLLLKTMAQYGYFKDKYEND